MKNLTITKNRIITGALSLFPFLFMASCGSDTPSFSLTSVEDSFLQNSDQQQVSKVDILWVVDNSGSMKASQDNLAANFNSFISNFTTENLDFQIAVTATDAFRANSSYDSFSNSSYSLFRTGDGVTDSGISIINNSTTDINSTFLTNVTIGTGGTGDERAFSSIEETINNAANSGLIRENSFLAVIIVSDEEDFSRDRLIGDFSGTAHPISRYVDALDAATGSTPEKRRYNVSSIHILDGDTACMQEQENAVPGNQGQKYGIRYEELTAATGGDNISLCSDFGVSLNTLSEGIIEALLIETFTIEREPIVSTLRVKVNGLDIPMSETNGWQYSNPGPDEYVITFTGSAVPPAGASVKISFDPLTFQE